MMSQLLIKGGKCVCPGAIINADILVDDGRIVAIAQNLNSSAETVIDARGKLIIPGGIDVHMHMPWPYGEFVSVDDINNGTKAAAFGGVTSVIDFALSEPDGNLSDPLEEKISEARSNAWVDYSFHLNVRGEIAPKLAELPDLIKKGFPSCKVFMAYEGFRVPDSDLLQVMEVIQKAGGLLNVHAENGLLADRLTSKLIESGEVALKYYPQARPIACEVEAISRLLTYVRVVGTPVHIHHVSTGQGAELIAAARREGLPVTGETCAHYLLFTSEDYMGDQLFAAYLVCAPNIKSSMDQEILWKNLANGSLPILATDHCPYTKAQKEKYLDDFSKVPGGTGEIETKLPTLYTKGVLGGRISLGQFVNAWSTQAAKAFGLCPRKGVIAVGFDADLVIFNPEKEDKIQAKNLHMSKDWTPYEDWKVAGLNLTTILRGEIVVQDGKLVAAKPSGQLVPRFLDRQS